MYEIRIHGRGGQGAVTAAEVIAIAAFKEGEQWVQAFPSFGVERRGAAIQAFVRIDKKPIRLRSQIYEPDFVIVLDQTLLKEVNVLAGIKEDSVVIVNAKKDFFLGINNLYYVDATNIALETMGVAITNVPMVGAFAKIIEKKFRGKIQFSLEDLNTAIKKKFKGKSKVIEGNLNAVEISYNKVEETSEKNKKDADRIGKNFRKKLGEMLPPPSKATEISKIVSPGTTIQTKTGGWRVFRPVLDLSKCTGCGICKQYCPEPSITMKDGTPVIEYDYCKGCGICAKECPKEAIKMEIERANDMFDEFEKIRAQIDNEPFTRKEGNRTIYI